MSNPNFVSDLVAMAKAFEELPQVQERLDVCRDELGKAAATIQRLELKLMDRANEIDALNAAVRKAEVERDHAERMFLETDDRLNALRSLIRSFQAETDALAKASEPVPAEGMKQIGEDIAFNYPNAPAEPFRQEYRPTPDVHDRADEVQPVEAVTKPVASEDHIDMGLAPQGQSAQGEQSSATTETAAAQQASASETVTPKDTAFGDSAGVSVSDYPTSANSPSAGSASPADTAQGTADATKSLGESDEGKQLHSDPAPTAPSQLPVETLAPTAIVDDIGYHNEPKIGNSGDPSDWDAWDVWRLRMDARYGVGRWPSREEPMPQASRASQYSF